MRKLWIVNIIIMTLIVSLGCSINGINIDTVKVGELTRDTEVVELGDAESVRVDVKMGAGELSIDGDAEDLMEAEFTYNVSDWKPKVHYQINEDQGRLTLEQPRNDKISLPVDIRYEWDLHFKQDVPLDMRINGGAGQSDFKLGALAVTRVDFQLGAGNVDIDLSGNTSLEQMDVDMGAGSVTLDLRGEWKHNVDIDIQGGIGSTHLTLPENIGVRIKVDKGLGDIDASGLYRRDGLYVNSAYEESDVTIKINVQAGIGQVELTVEE